MFDDIDQGSLRDAVAALARIERGPTSQGEREAALQIAERLRAHGLDPRIEEGSAYDSYARPIGALSAIGAGAGLFALVAGARALPAVLATLSAAAIAEDVSNGPRLFRRATMRRRPTWNVIAEAGDRHAPRTLVVLAHHDAAPTGAIFDPTLQRLFAERFPALVERLDTSLPLWAPVVGGPLLVALGALRPGGRRMIAAGTALAAAATAAFVDIARSPIVPGANDNLTAVAALIELARLLSKRERPGLRVLLVSCGSEESLQGGMRCFAAEHFAQLPPESTMFLNLETIGSPRLAMLEGEGPLKMEDYAAPEFRDLIARVAEREGIALRRKLRSRASTDSVIASRAGYPTATLISINAHKALENYHLMSDTAENVNYDTLALAVALTEALIAELAGQTAR
ncbi:MAG: M28 family metallopeptidase [Solirubrobacteraceae bacterium]